MIETDADREEFFDLEDFAVPCELSGPDSFTATIAVIMNAVTETVDLYDTNIEAANAHFLCTHLALAGVQRSKVKQYSAVIESVTYKLERIEDEADGKTVLVYLKKGGGIGR